MAMAADVRVAAESAAYVIAAVSNHPSTARVQRVAKLRDKRWQVTVLQGTVAARMDELQLGEALAAAHNEQQRKDMLHKIMQQAAPHGGRRAVDCSAERQSPCLGCLLKQADQSLS